MTAGSLILKPCKHCKSETAPRLTQSDDVIQKCNCKVRYIDWRVVCDANAGGCGAAGGYRPYQEEAGKAWNMPDVASSEIPVVDEKGLRQQLEVGLALGKAGKVDGVEAIIRIIRPYLRTTEPIFSVDDEDDLQQKLASAMAESDSDYAMDWAGRCMPVIRPYLRHPEPVSLEDVTHKVMVSEGRGHEIDDVDHVNNWRRETKAVLDAAGVKYVD